MGAGNSRLSTAVNDTNLENEELRPHEDLATIPPSPSSSSPLNEQEEFRPSHPVIAAAVGAGDASKKSKSQHLELERNVEFCASVDGEGHVVSSIPSAGSQLCHHHVPSS